VRTCRELSQWRCSAPALGQREQDRAAGLADHGVGLPVSGAGAFLDELRPFVNRNPAPDLAPALITPVAFPALFLATQVGMEITATALVRINMLVDPFVTDMQSLLHRQPAADLLRTPLLAQQTLNTFPGSGGNPRLGLGLAAGQGQVLRLLRAVAAKTPVVPNLTADRGLVTLQHVGSPALAVAHFQKCCNLVAFFLGELRVVSHRCLSCLLL
jgi:hypothetical protein